MYHYISLHLGALSSLTKSLRAFPPDTPLRHVLDLYLLIGRYVAWLQHNGIYVYVDDSGQWAFRNGGVCD